MTNVQQDKEAMVSLTSKTLTEAAPDVLLEMPGIGVPIAALAEKVDLIRVNAALQIEDLAGFAVEKLDRRNLMEGLTQFNCKKAASFAFNSNIPVLLNKVNINPSYLPGLSNTDSAAACRDRYNVILPYLSSLLPYGVTAGKLADTNDAINAFNAFKNEPRENIDTRKAATDAIANLFVECDEILVGTDFAVDGLNESQPAFYTKYFNGRQIKHTGGRVLSLRGKITTVDGLPLSGVRIVIHGVHTIVKKSTDLGNFQVKNLITGMYKVTLSKVGMVTVDMEIAVTSNERSELEVVMHEIVVVAV